MVPTQPDSHETDARAINRIEVIFFMVLNSDTLVVVNGKKKTEQFLEKR